MDTIECFAPLSLPGEAPVQGETPPVLPPPPNRPGTSGSIDRSRTGSAHLPLAHGSNAAAQDEVDAHPHGSAARLYDAELVRRFNLGDLDVFNEMVARHRRRLVALALNFLKNPADAEEIAQDALVRAYRALGTFRGESSLGTWLRRITVNLAINRYGYEHRRFRHTTDSFDSRVHPESSLTLGDLCVCPAPDPALDSELRELSASVDRCMALLRDDQREILRLRTVLENSYEQIAATLGLRLGTVKSRIARARTCLRILIEQDTANKPPGDASADPDLPTVLVSTLNPARSHHECSRPSFRPAAPHLQRRLRAARDHSPRLALSSCAA